MNRKFDRCSKGMSFDRLNVYINRGTKYLLRKNRIFRQNKLVDLVSLVYSILYAIDIIAKRWSDMGDGIRERKMRNRK